MVKIWIPSLLRNLTNGADVISVHGKTVDECIDALDALFPGLRNRLCDGNELIPSLSVAIDGKISHRGVKTRVNDKSEIHFVPAVAGG